MNRTLSTQYNVVFILVDDLRTDLGTYRTNNEHRADFTPNLDNFAKKSIQFDRVYVQVALCGPSRASILTGRNPRSLEYFQHNMDDVKDIDVIYRSPGQSLPKLFESAGYSTNGAGKLFHRSENSEDEFQDFLTTKSNQCECDSSTEICPKMTCTVSEEEEPDLTDYDVLEYGLENLESFAESGEPFFLSLGIRKPHLPYRIPQRLFENTFSKYGSDLNNIPLPDPKEREEEYSVSNYYCDAADSYFSALELTFRPNSKRVLENNNVTFASSELSFFTERNEYEGGIPIDGGPSSSTGSSSVSTQLGSEVIPDDLIASMRLGYFSAVSWVDEIIGNMQSKIEELDLDDNTVVIVTSDNGFNLGEQGNFCKNNNFEISTRVPLYIKHPEMPNSNNGKKISRILSAIDFMPTILELAGVDTTASQDYFHGESFAQLVLEEVTEPEYSEVSDLAFSAVYRCYNRSTKQLLNCASTDLVNIIGYSVRSNNFRYTEWRNINLQGDTPFETSFGDNALLDVDLYDHTYDDGYHPDEYESINLANDEKFVKKYQNLINTLSNHIKAHFMCPEGSCVPITSTLTPTNIPTTEPTRSDPTPFPSYRPTENPSYLIETSDTRAPTSESERFGETVIGHSANGMQVGISVVIILAVLAISVTLFVWSKERSFQKRKKQRLKFEKRLRRRDVKLKELRVTLDC
eukprot:augustus_masked-scaffold_7-processed-gene-15.48-mRNA-1 protein AED:1.00 eAED:1.00 QI:0/-1/0/0/-1/1/1/0/690